MLWIAILVCASVVFVLRCCPDTQMARTLHKHLVERPVARVSQIARTDLIYFLIVAGLFTVGGEVVAMVGPEFALVYAADLALYVDFLVVAALVAANTRLRLTFQSFRAFVSRLRHSGRRNPRPGISKRARRSTQPRRPADNDSDDSWVAFRSAA
jgi:hypothetical protein